MKTAYLRLFVLTLICLSLAPLQAQTIWTNLGDGVSWSDSGNWSLGVPTSSSDVQILTQPSIGIIGVDTGGATIIKSFTFDSGIGLTSGVLVEALGSETLQVNGAITNSSNFNQSFSLTVFAGANASYSGGSAGLTFEELSVGTDHLATSGNIFVNDLVLTINSAASFGQFGGFTGTGITPTINVAGTYTGTLGNSFQLITGSFSGATLGSLPTLTSGLSWNTSLFASNGTISVVPEPSQAALLFLGLGLMAIAKVAFRRRAILL